MRTFRTACLAAAFALLAAPGAAFGQEQGQPSAGRPVDPLDEVRRAILVRDQVIRSLLERMQSLEQTVQQLREQVREQVRSGQAAAPVPQASEPAGPDVAEAEAPPPATGQEAEPAAPPALSDAEQREQEQLIRTAFDRALIERGALLLPTWTAEAELGLNYVHSAADHILIDGFTILPVLVVGDIVSERIRQDQLQATGTLRLGLPWNLQVETRVPFGYQRRLIVTAENQESTSDNISLGDLELAVSSQLLIGRDWMPDLLGTVRWKTTTGGDPFDTTAGDDTLTLGTGFNSVSTTLTAVKLADPVVFFGSATYTYNDPIEIDAGRFNPGDSIGVQFGLALALNLDTSISFAYDQSYTLESELDGDPLPGSTLTTGTFTVGFSNAITNRLAIDVSVGIGVTEDSPDLQVGLSLPFRFSL